MDRLLREHFSVPYDDTQPATNANGFIRIPIKELLSFRRTVPEGQVDFKNINRSVAGQYMIKKMEKHIHNKESMELRLSNAQERREIIEGVLRKKLDEQAKRKEEARAQMRLQAQLDEQYRIDAYLCKFYTKMILAFRHVRGFFKAMEEMKNQMWVQEK